MCSTSEMGIQELDRRTNHGIDVALLWSSRTNEICVAVDDERGDSFRLEVDPAHALDAFHHPYAYADRSYAAYARARLSELGPHLG